MAHHHKGYHVDFIMLFIAACAALHYTGKLFKYLIDWILLIITGKRHDIWEE